MPRGRVWAAGVLVVALAAGLGCSNNTDTLGSGNQFHVDGNSYNEIFTCSQQFTASPPFCADLNSSDTINFHLTGGGVYEVRDVPDTGFVYMGTFSGTVFTWTATSPDGYTEQGTWTFNMTATSFTGSSTYAANDGSYTGECNANGSIAPHTPPNPAPIGACP
jgi:hypothetical protein